MENPASKDQSQTRGLRSVLVQALGIRELSHAALGLILLLCLVIPVAHALRLGPLWPSVFGFALVILIARAPLGASSRRAALITIGICFALHLTAQLLSIENHFVDPESDFRTQWETAIDYVNWGVQVPDRPQTQRALPFYYPLVWLFGSSSTVYLLANVVLTSSTYLMSVWIARRYFGWSAAAKTALMLLFGFEVLFAIKFPSHDVLNSFGFLLFLVLLVETEVHVDRPSALSRSRLAAIGALALMMSLTITWLDWQRGTGLFCMAAILFYGFAGFVRRLARWKLRSAIALGVCLFSVLQTARLSSCGLVAPTNPTGLNSTEMIVLTMGTEEADGRYGDWYRSARMATELEPDAVSRLGPMLFAETLRTNASGKYEMYLLRQLNFLRTGQDPFWYLTVKDPRWLSQEEVTSLYGTLAKWTPPIWWAIALLLGIAIFRRDVLFDFRIAPVILVGAFMAIMGSFAECQSRHSMFLVFLWPIYAGSPFVANPLARARGEAPITRRTMARGAITVAVVIAIPLVIKQLIPRAPLANFAKAKIAIGTSDWAKDPVGAPPETIALRNYLHVSDFEMTGCPEAPACRPGAQSFGRTVTATTKIFAEDQQTTLRFVLYNEIGGAFDELLPRPERFGTLPRRALRVFDDDALVKTIDLASPFTPRVIEIPGFKKGPHFVKLALDLGEPGHVPRTAGKTCYHFWSAPMRCVGTSIAYLGFY